jgi:hypothetical protein
MTHLELVTVVAGFELPSVLVTRKGLEPRREGSSSTLPPSAAMGKKRAQGREAWAPRDGEDACDIPGHEHNIGRGRSVFFPAWSTMAS